MAKITQLVCDWDGKTKFSPNEGGTEDFLFEVDGKRFVIDLSDKGKAAFDGTMDAVKVKLAEVQAEVAKLLEPWKQKARPAPLTDAEKAHIARQYSQKVKKWHDDRGLEYNKGGKLRSDYLARYERETGDPIPDFMRPEVK